MNEQKPGLGTIYQGELVYYYPLKFDTPLAFEELCKHVGQAVERAFSSCQNETADALKASIQAKFGKAEVHKRAQQKPTSCRFHEAKIILNPTSTSLQVGMYSACMIAHSERVEEGENEYSLYRSTYGDSFVSLQDRILLPPLNVTLCNGETVWLNAFLIVFKNKMGILKLELPLINVSAEHFKNYNTDAYVSSVVGGCFAHEGTTAIAFSEIHQAYIKNILSWSVGVISQIFCGEPISNIILGDCEGSPMKIEDIPLPVQADLYEIIAAPIGERAYVSTALDAEQYLHSHSWGNHLIKCFTSTNGGCLTLIEKEIVQKRIAEYAEKTGTSSDDEQVKRDVCRIMIQSAAINTEFSLAVLALKKMNNDYILREKAVGRRTLLDTQAEYNRTLILIADLQRNCMGTVHEQLQAFEKAMPYYLNADLAEVKLSAIDRIQLNKENAIRERSQSLISFLGVMLAAVFGLPAIHDTISIIHGMFLSNHADSPYFSVRAASVLCWGVLLVSIGIWTYKTMRKRR